MRLAAVFILVAAPALAQSDALLDQLAGVLDRGKLNVEVNLKQGQAAITPQWTLQTTGTPKASVIIEANEGRVSCLDVDVTGGTLVIAGKGFRPSIEVEGLRFEDGSGVTDARFRGRGVWRPIVAVFRTLARPALRGLIVNTDIQSILRGEIVASEKEPSNSSPAFLSLVRNVNIHDTEFDAFSGYPFAFGSLIDFDTKTLRVNIDKATFTPPAQFEADGRIDGEIDNGAAAFLGNHGRFSRGQLRKGTFHADQSGVAFAAGTLAIDLTSGEFRWPGGPRIGVDSPSHFAVTDLRLKPDGSYSGVVDAALFGKVGSIDRAGIRIAANDVEMHISGARIVDGKATGDAKLRFQYRLNHTLVVHYPVEELRDRKVPLLFQGLFDADLHFENAGSGDEGAVTGTYRFTVPWPPLEQAAFEVLRARWQQDLTPAIHKVQFTLEPRRFGPCGGDCFVLDLKVVAAKSKLRQICDTEEKADLVIDPASRSVMLKNIRVQPRCEGLLGKVVNYLTPFLTKSYSDIALIQMPADLPFTIDSVGSAADSLFIGGKIDWSAAGQMSVGISSRMPVESKSY